MKLTALLIVFATLQSIGNSYSQSPEVTLDFRNAPIAQVFQEIEKQSNFRFLYINEAVKDKMATLNVKKENVDKVLDKLLADVDMKYTVLENNLIVITPISLASKQGVQIRGKVTATTTGESLPGVNVLEKGTMNGAVTDLNGNYAIIVSGQDAVLVFSSVGYTQEEVAVGNQTTINMTLVESIEALDEVVVVGYGTVLKKDVTTAIAKVDPTEIPAAANSNVNDLLFGRAAGLRVTQQSAQPGGQIDLSVRGRGDFKNPDQGQPLIVVDGVVIPNTALEPGINFAEINNVRRGALAGINPNDIESIEVLKDGAASIYGVEAANGVILITTKKGKEGRMNVSYGGSHSWSKNMPYLEALNATEYMTYFNRLTQDKYLADSSMQPFGSRTPADVPQPFSAQEIADAGTGTDWLGEILRNGSIENHNLSINGGSERVLYYFSCNYFNQLGTVENSDMTKYNGRMNLSFKLNKILTLNTDLSATRNNFNNTVAGWQTGGAGSNGFTALQAAIAYPSYVPVKDPVTGEYSHFGTTGNPVALLDIRDKTDNNSLIANVSLDVSIIPKLLTMKLLYGNNSENSTRDFFIPSTTNWFDDYLARASLQFSRRQYQTFESYATFNKMLGEVLNTNIVAGFGQYMYNDDGYGLQSTNMLDAINTANVAAGQAPVVNSYKNKNTKRSYFVRGTFDILDRYLLTAAWRYDGYSQFYPDSKYASFPSASLGWKISNEPFLKGIEAINLLKLRASIGMLGKLLPSGTAYGTFLPDANNVSFEDGSIIVAPYFLSQIDHPNLSWEKTINKNIGFDFGLLNNRITGALDWFRDDVTDLLNANALTPPLSLIAQQPVNGGHQVRKGYEIALNAYVVRTQSLNWNLSLNVSHYSIRWEERFEEDLKSLPNYQEIKDPVYALYAYETNGILQLDQEIPASQPDFPLAGTRLAGAPIFVDQNGDNQIDSSDVQMYDQIPKVNIGVGSTFRYRNLDLTVFLYGQFGAYRPDYSLNWAVAGNLLAGNQSGTKDVKYVWTTENQGGTLPGAAYSESVFTSTNTSGVGSDYLISKSDFVRCRNITLGYTFGMPSVAKYVKDLRIYFDVQNPFIITKYKGTDPEIMAPAVKGAAAPYPMVTNYSLGVNVNF